MLPSSPTPLHVAVEARLRGVAGGFMFAVPILYTMETWWLGYTLGTWIVVAYVIVGLGVGWLLNLTTAADEDHSPARAPADAVEALAIGVLCSALTLVVIAEIDAQSSPIAAVRQVLLLAVPVSVGATISRTELGDSEPEPGAEAEQPTPLLVLGKTVAGAFMLGFPAASTEEIRMIADRLVWGHFAAIVALSLVLIYVFVFVAGFRGQSDRQGGVADVVTCYGVALVASAGLIAFLGFIEPSDGPAEALRMLFVLGVPAAVGAAAGRIIA